MVFLNHKASILYKIISLHKTQELKLCACYSTISTDVSKHNRPIAINRQIISFINSILGEL